MAPELLWRGDFIDAGHHWTDRGVGYEPPASTEVTRISNKMAIAFTSEAGNAWPAATKAAPRFRGYQLDAKGNPTFAIESEGQKLLDQYQVESGGVLLRKIKVAGNATQPISMLVLADHDIQQPSPESFMAGAVKVSIEGGTFRYGNQAVILDLKNQDFTIRYTWQ